MDTMNKLDKLAQKYGSDKFGKHHYTPVYYELLNDLKDNSIDLLEIGVAEGAGLRMFAEFLPKANIYGVDNDPKRVDDLNWDKRFTVVLGDQERPFKFFYVFKKRNVTFDLIIDDGSHKIQHQYYTCLCMLPLLKDDGVYVIEDVADDELIERLREKDTINGKKYIFEEVRVGERYDDRLIIIKRING